MARVEEAHVLNGRLYSTESSFSTRLGTHDEAETQERVFESLYT